MIRISTIFIAICMVLVAASLGLVVYSLIGLTIPESAIVALTALTFLILYNAVSMRLRDRTDVGGQIADLSRGTADLARQVAEYGRRLSAIESKLDMTDATGQDRVYSVMGEINELGVLVKQLASTVAAHDDLLSDATAKAEVDALIVPVPREPANAGSEHHPPRAAASVTRESILPAVKSAVEANRIDLYLQPIVTLPQRKVRFYEAVARLSDDKDQLLTASDFIGTAEAAGLIGQIDHMVLFRCIQVLRRLMTRTKDVGIFCNMAASTLASREIFSQCMDFLEANRALAPSFILEFKQSTFRALGPVESEHLAKLARLGYHFSIDNVIDLRFDPRELADRSVRFMKVPAALLLDQKQLSTSDIHAADLSDLLGRYGIDLVAERIEGERAVVDLLDYDVRFGQGFLFSPPRPLRPEGTADSKPAETKTPTPNLAATGSSGDTGIAVPADLQVKTGNAALVQRAVAQR
jgi:cyclic-di-GMP phosphodiesterase TipF (flagellum assembly factor)